MRINLRSATSNTLREYAVKVRAFKPNARLYLLNIIITGVAMGILRLLFNFYVLSLGYDEVLVGKLVTVNNMTALLVALPTGYLADYLGRKKALLTGGSLSALAVLAMVIWPEVTMLYLANVLFGFSQSLLTVTNAPFLMENSGEEERTYLFSFASGLMMAAASLGNWIGGYLPTWVASMRLVTPTSSAAYAGALWIASFVAMAGLLPLFFLRASHARRSERTAFAPIRYATKNPVLLSKLILPMLITSIGAGLIMPFMNVFYRQVYHQPDPVIGAMFAWGSLAMGLGLLLAPPLADRMGKIQLVVVTQALSVPFLVMMGFSPWFWLSAAAYYIRLALMNMSSPVYQTFVMERVEPGARATVASLEGMAWNFGWAFSPMISGWLQVNYGFGPAFLGTIILYSVSIVLYWAFFWREPVEAVPAVVPGD